LIKLNVGGRPVDIRRQTVKSFPKNHLSAILSGRYDAILPKDKDGRLFLDIDLDHLEPILNYMRDYANGIEEAHSVNSLLAQNVTTVMRYFNLSIPFEQLLDTTILTDDDIEWVSNELKLSPCSFKLLHRGSHDTFSKANFPKRACGSNASHVGLMGKRLMMVIRDTDQNVFGACSIFQVGASNPQANPYNISQMMSFRNSPVFSLKGKGGHRELYGGHSSIPNVVILEDNPGTAFPGSDSSRAFRDSSLARQSYIWLRDKANMVSGSSVRYYAPGTATDPGQNLSVPFVVSEFEIFEVSPLPKAPMVTKPRTNSGDSATSLKPASSAIPSIAMKMQELSDLQASIEGYSASLLRSDAEYQNDLRTLREELKFVAHFAGLDDPYEEKDESNADPNGGSTCCCIDNENCAVAKATSNSLSTINSPVTSSSSSKRALQPQAPQIAGSSLFVRSSSSTADLQTAPDPQTVQQEREESHEEEASILAAINVYAGVIKKEMLRKLSLDRDTRAPMASNGGEGTRAHEESSEMLKGNEEHKEQPSKRQRSGGKASDDDADTLRGGDRDSDGDDVNVSNRQRVLNINAGGSVVTVSASTLMEAPKGSYLYNLASTRWGHEYDEEGNLFQDVHPECFRKIISYLRMKSLERFVSIQAFGQNEPKEDEQLTIPKLHMNTSSPVLWRPGCPLHSSASAGASRIDVDTSSSWVMKASSTSSIGSLALEGRNDIVIPQELRVPLDHLLSYYQLVDVNVKTYRYNLC
jgi:hypothetical protein